MEIINQTLADELLKMSKADQAMRIKAQQTDEWDKSIDEHNTAKLKEVVAAIG